MTPTTIALTVLVLVLLGDSALAISLGARTAETRREIARIQSRLDSLSRHQEDLSRRLLVRDALATASNGRIPASQISRLASEIDRNSRLYNFDPLLILAVVLTESQGDFNATGKFTSGAASGAVGVMQVKPSIQLNTAHPHFGAVKSLCRNCRSQLRRADKGLYCDHCEEYESRKVADDYGFVETILITGKE